VTVADIAIQLNEATCYALPAQTVPGRWEVLMWESGEWHFMSKYDGPDARPQATAEAERLNKEFGV
jgi:hypothetical protein